MLRTSRNALSRDRNSLTLTSDTLIAPGTENRSSPSVSDREATDLKRKAARGGLVSMGGQAANFVLRTGSMIIMARLLTPRDFGLVGMVAAFTGFLGLFKDLGLSMATVQQASITDAQTSTLFWVNLAAGGLLAALCSLLAPAVAAFYGEPRLLWVTSALGISFLFNGAGAQHRALLQRGMRFGALAVIDLVSLVFSVVAGITLALAGAGYWALVVVAVSPQAVASIGAWLSTRWLPGRPQRRAGVRSMLVYGGTSTLNNLVVYVAFNMDKVLLGRFCGAELLGIYGRAYQLVNVPTENLNATIGQVAFPALSRLQHDPVRLRSYFLKGYRLFLSMALPAIVGCGLYAEDIVRVFLGAKWHEAASIFRLLSAGLLAFALVNPFAWLLQATGRAGRSLRIALALTPLLGVAYVIGLGEGPQGVAMGYSFCFIVSCVPIIVWARHGTCISGGDVLRAVMPPAASVVFAAAASLAGRSLLGSLQPALLRLVAETGLLFGVYFLVLLFVMNQKQVYLALLRDTGLWPVWGSNTNPDSKS